MTANLWTKGVAGPQHRAALLCIPHIAAGASAFAAFRRAAPPWLRCGAVRFSGRETRLLEECTTDPENYVGDIIDAGERLAEGSPLALLGQCSGVSLAMAAAERLCERVRVFAIVAVNAPAPTARPIVIDPAMTDNQLLRWFVRAGEFSAELLDDAEMMELLVPVVRADALALSRLSPPTAPSDLPIFVVRGADDPLLTAEHLADWSVWSPRVETETIPGGHLLAVDSVSALWEKTARFLEDRLSAL